MYCNENTSKGSKIDHRLYIMQEVKAIFILKLNGQEGLNQVFFDEIYSNPLRKNDPTKKSV